MPKFLFVAVIGMALYFSYAISLHGGLGGFVAGVFIGVTATLFLQRTRIPQNAPQQPTTAVQVNNIEPISPDAARAIDELIQRRVNGAVRAMLVSGDTEE